MESSTSKSHPFLLLLPLLLLLLLFAHSANARFSSDGVDVLRDLPARASLSHSHRASPSSSSSSSSSFSFAAREDDGERRREEREEALLSCINNNMEYALLQAKITKEIINDFKESYTKTKFDMPWSNMSSTIPWEWDEGMFDVCSVEQTCSTVLPSLSPTTMPPPATDSDAVKTLSELSSHVFRFAYAFEHLVMDQVLREDIFGKEMNDAFVSHKKLSTLLEQVLQVCGLEANYTDLLPFNGKMYVDRNKAEIDLRGFSTLRQSLHCLELLENMFEEKVMLLGQLLVERENEEEEEDEEAEVVFHKKNRTKKNGRSGRKGKNKKGNKRRKRMRNHSH